jgi:serine phosphatase RsbU (regulator of sigma subunit)
MGQTATASKRDPQESEKISPLLYGGVFLLFGPMGVLVGLIQPNPAGWVVGLMLVVFSGTIALGWLQAIQRRQYWLLVPINLIAFFFPPFLFAKLYRMGIFSMGYDWDPFARRAVLAVMVVALISAGFVLIVRYIRQESRTAERARAELNVAKGIHARVAPPIDLRQGPIEVLGRSRSSEEMGGDLIDAIAAPGAGAVEVILADVSGHGVGAGIVMSMLKSAIRTRLTARVPLATLLADINGVLTDLTDEHMFATVSCARIYEDGRVEYALAGHLPIIVVTGDGHTRRIEELANENLPIGITHDEAFSSGVTRLLPGDTLLFITDGLTEVRSPQGGKELGMAPVRDVFAAGADESLDALCSRIFSATDAHGPRTDDQSVLLVRFGSPASPVR